ncbi:MAG: methylenetetrahydrofolate reductase [Gaiellaceae bacterium]
MVAEHVPKEIKLTVTSSPARGIESTLLLTEQLVKQGYAVVPHIAARLLVDEAHLGEVLARLQDRDVREIFVVAGDQEQPAGKFFDSVALLAAIEDSGHRLDEIGIAGYPEGHPFVSAEALFRVLRQKEKRSTYVVSQVSFDAGRIGSWVQAVRRKGVQLPIYVGLPGVADRQKLLRISIKIGVGESARYLAKNRTWLGRLFLAGAFSSEQLIEGLAPQLAEPESDVAGFHMYTFNEVERTEKWRRETIERFDAVRHQAGAT